MIETLLTLVAGYVVCVLFPTPGVGNRVIALWVKLFGKTMAPTPTVAAPVSKMTTTTPVA